MIKNITAVQARKNFGSILEEAFYRGDQFIIQRSGKPMAAVVPIAVWEQWQRALEEDFKIFDEIWAKNPNVDEEELEQDVASALEEVRSAKRQNSPPASPQEKGATQRGKEVA